MGHCPRTIAVGAARKGGPYRDPPDGARERIKIRGVEAGIPDLHPHRSRFVG